MLRFMLGLFKRIDKGDAKILDSLPAVKVESRPEWRMDRRENWWHDHGGMVSK